MREPRSRNPTRMLDRLPQDSLDGRKQAFWEVSGGDLGEGFFCVFDSSYRFQSQ